MMPDITYDFTTTVWTYFNGKATYYLATLPAKIGKAVRDTQEGRPRRGWGSIRVALTIGDTTWKTSIFPESGTKSYLFLINAKVRKAESLTDGQKIKVSLRLLD